ncbi:hypothetical protein ACFVAD_20260 [Sutcliffiella sp. NPDC057660]|uniref:hypothetical protein n=1 Tax=Sutcliffiella sp. NPDC057660 TaxID=3346199 RepID=UPI0036CFFB7D
MFEKSAREIERRFIRRVSKNNSILTFTVKGRINYINKISDSFLSITTNKSVKPFSISRKSIRKAISFFIDSKTITRKQLQCYSKFTSSLLAVLVDVFTDKVILRKMKSGEVRISLTGTRVFASGLEKDPYIRGELKKLGGKYLLLNYYHIRGNRNWKRILDEGFHCIVDSGAFSTFRYKQRWNKKLDNQLELFHIDEVEMISVEEYANFINKECQDNRIKAFINLDVIGDPQQTRSNYERLKSLCPAATIWPVWQFNDTVDNLMELSQEEHEVICIGGLVPSILKHKEETKARLIDLVNKFPEVNFHCLGLANRWLCEISLFSADTTAFLNARKSPDQRKVYLETGERVSADEEMSTIDIIKQNLLHLINLEKEPVKQLSLF